MLIKLETACRCYRYIRRTESEFDSCRRNGILMPFYDTSKGVGVSIKIDPSQGAYERRLFKFYRFVNDDTEKIAIFREVLNQ